MLNIGGKLEMERDKGLPPYAVQNVTILYENLSA